jgi:hypothetical protein
MDALRYKSGGGMACRSLSDERIMRLAGAVYNASYTILRLRKEQLRLFTFNAVPHLAAPGLCTHR